MDPTKDTAALLSELIGAQSVGRLPDGRIIVKNGPESARGPGYSTRYAITEQTPWGWMNVPTMFGGLPDMEGAVSRILQTGGVDPDTGFALPAYPTREAAEAAARRESANTDFYLDQALSRAPGDPVRRGKLD